MMDRKNIPACPICKARMEHFSSIPAAAHLPELLRFKCQECGCFKTIEAPDSQVTPNQGAKAAA